jgi:hypothetical protein
VLRVVLALSFALLPGTASAQEGSPPASENEGEEEAEKKDTDAAELTAEEKKKAEKKKKKEERARREWTLEYGGRLFVRDTFTRIPIGDGVLWRHDRTLEQARVFATYERKKMRLAFEIEIDDGGGELKDTYIRLMPIPALRINAGRFKAPMSMIWLESKWSLPATERGILSDIRQEDRDLPFGGVRAEGVSIEARPAIAIEPRVTLAAFHNPVAGGATGLDPFDDFSQDLYGRIEIQPAPVLHAAASFALVGNTAEVGALDTYRHTGVGGVELHLDTPFLRAWAEGFVGESFFYQADGTTSGTFAAARALVAVQLDRPFGGLHRLEPFVFGSVLDPTGDVSGDRVSEVAGGASIAFSKHWRLQVEVAHRIAEGLAAPVADSTLFRIQLGAAFSEWVE